MRRRIKYPRTTRNKITKKLYQRESQSQPLQVQSSWCGCNAASAEVSFGPSRDRLLGCGAEFGSAKSASCTTAEVARAARARPAWPDRLDRRPRAVAITSAAGGDEVTRCRCGQRHTCLERRHSGGFRNKLRLPRSGRGEHGKIFSLESKGSLFLKFPGIRGNICTVRWWKFRRCVATGCVCAPMRNNCSPGAN